MGNGKLPNEILKQILEEIPTIQRDDVLIGAQMGVDTAHILFGDEICVLSTDPITGAVDNIGAIGVTVSVNDIATSGAEPVALLLTILAPDGTSHEEIEQIQRDATETANALGVQIIGGHTEITSAVNQCVLSVAAIGRLAVSEWMNVSKIREGDLVFVSKSVGLEGSAILSADRADALATVLTEEELLEARSYVNCISVLPEGRLGARLGSQYMHDITEGGLLGAVYEAAQAIGKGICIDNARIPITELTKKIASRFEIDPLKLISSGSMLLILPEERKEEALACFQEAGIDFTQIGLVTEEVACILTENGCEPIHPPTQDALYTALKRGRKDSLIIATDNPDKAGELRSMLGNLPYQVDTKKEAGLADLEIVEDGRTLEENALIKARAIAEVRPDSVVVADDTGLFVPHLNGEPGIYSARYAGEHCSYEDNCNKLLDALKDAEDRSAYFETVTALILPDGSAHTFRGRIDGVITTERAGYGGFGYDKIFMPDGYTQTFALMTDEEKNRISHRRRALEKLVDFLTRMNRIG